MYPFLKKLLFTFNPETAHLMIKNIARCLPDSLFALGHGVPDRNLSSTVGDVFFRSPIGLAAGFDKNGTMFPWLQNMGFGFIEIGSVTAAPCDGNPKPRLFRLPVDDSLINRMGLPNDGALIVAERIKGLKRKIPLGINIAKTPMINKTKLFKGTGIEDYLFSFKQLKDGGDFFILNLSCPNTTDGRTFEDPEMYRELIITLRADNPISKDIFVKLSPDLDDFQLKKIVELSLSNGIRGFVLTNTTKSRAGLLSSKSNLEKIGAGGLSGRALRSKALSTLIKVKEMTDNKAILVSCGGIMNFRDTLERIVHGAHYLEVYTAFIYQGPYFVSKLNKDLSQFCLKHKINNYQEIIGQKSLLK